MPIGLAPNDRSKFQVYQYEASDMSGADLFDLPFNPGTKIRGYTAFDEPACQVIIEDFMPGTEFQWTFTHDEYQYAISGEIEIEVFEPPLYAESTKTTFKAGSVYLFPVGSRMHVKVIGDEPYRHICFCPPSPGYPFPSVEDVRKGSK